MSIISSYSTRIRVAPRSARGAGKHTDKTWEILHEAVIATAERLGGEVCSTISDYNGQTKACDFAIVTPEFTRGVGLTVSPGGEVRFLYDAYGGYKKQAQKICDAVQQSFTSIAVTRALRSLNYDVDVQEVGEGSSRQVMVTGVM